MDNYTERLELPDGEYGMFRTRIGYGGALAIRRALAADANEVVFMDAVLRAVLVKATIRDHESGELLVNVGAESVDRGNPKTIDAFQVKAMELYIAWSAEAFPKAPEATDGESDAPETSRSGPRSGRSKRKTKT